MKIKIAELPKTIKIAQKTTWAHSVTPTSPSQLLRSKKKLFHWFHSRKNDQFGQNSKKRKRKWWTRRYRRIPTIPTSLKTASSVRDLCYKTFTTVIYECLPLVNLPNLVKCLWVRPGVDLIKLFWRIFTYSIL